MTGTPTDPHSVASPDAQARLERNPDAIAAIQRAERALRDGQAVDVEVPVVAGSSTDLIREGREKLRGVTDGAWATERRNAVFGYVTEVHSVERETVAGNGCITVVSRALTEADAEFIVWARNNLPAVLDALEGVQARRERRGRAFVAAVQERDALIEAVERVKALRGSRITEGMIERAIHPGNHEQCPSCGGWDGFHALVTRSVMGGEGDTAYAGIMSSPCPRRGES